MYLGIFWITSVQGNNQESGSKNTNRYGLEDITEMTDTELRRLLEEADQEEPVVYNDFHDELLNEHFRAELGDMDSLIPQMLLMVIFGIRCAVHTLQLAVNAVNDAINSSNALLIKEIVLCCRQKIEKPDICIRFRKRRNKLYNSGARMFYSLELILLHGKNLI